MQGNRTREVGQPLEFTERGKRGQYFLDNEGVSPNKSEPDSAWLRLDGGGRPSRDGHYPNSYLENMSPALTGEREGSGSLSLPSIIPEGSQGHKYHPCGQSHETKISKRQHIISCSQVATLLQ